MRPSRLLVPLVPLLLLASACGGDRADEDPAARGAGGPPGRQGSPDSLAEAPPPTAQAPALRVHYLEIVTGEVDATCAALKTLHGVRFGAPEPALGSARTAPLRGGGRVGVRPPPRADGRLSCGPTIG
jgi:hypothetical protein